MVTENEPKSKANSDADRVVLEYLTALDENRPVDLESLLRKCPAAAAEVMSFITDFSLVQSVFSGLDEELPEALAPRINSPPTEAKNQKLPTNSNALQSTVLDFSRTDKNLPEELEVRRANGKQAACPTGHAALDDHEATSASNGLSNSEGRGVDVADFLKLVSLSPGADSTNGEVGQDSGYVQTELGKDTDGRDASTPSGAPAHRFGRFEILSLLGQGGFGIVWKAFDTRLRRAVALKIPRFDTPLSQPSRERFFREAQSAALLEHPGIVPVFESGQVGSLCYVVTAYCEGPTLAKWQSENRPVSIEFAAQITLQVANAVSHAHSRGILHRDIKPANVLLEPLKNHPPSNGLPFQPRITDFGLAKNIDAKYALTETGELVGTVRYMAPEQAAGDAKQVSVQTDVYGLGVMLYELLTGKLPCAGATHFETLRRIQQEPPRSPRAFRRDVPQDLEAICLKCLEKRPEVRFATVSALASDLNRYIAGEPVTARPVSFVSRVVSYSRRRPLVATLVALLFLAIAGGTYGGVALYRHERTLRRTAERNEQFARQAVDDMYTQVAEKWLATDLRGEDREALRSEFLLKALSFYEELAKEKRTDPEARHAVSVALHRAANVYSQLGTTTEAIATRKRCLAVLDELLIDSPNDRTFRYDHFYNLMILSGELTQTGGPSMETASEAYLAISELAEEYPDEPIYQDALSATGISWGFSLFDHTRDPKKAEIVFQRSLDVAKRIAKQYPERTLYARNVYRNLMALAYMAQVRRDFAAEEKLYQEAEEVYPRYAQDHAHLHGVRSDLAELYRARAVALMNLKLADEADELLTEALTILEDLLEKFPNNTVYRYERIRTLLDLGRVYHERGRMKLSIDCYKRGFAHGRDEANAHPDVAWHREKLEGWIRGCPIEELREEALAEEGLAEQVLSNEPGTVSK